VISGAFNREQINPPHAWGIWETHSVALHTHRFRARSRTRSRTRPPVPPYEARHGRKANALRMDQASSGGPRRYSGALKLLIIFGSSVVLWALILWAAFALFGWSRRETALFAALFSDGPDKTWTARKLMVDRSRARLRAACFLPAWPPICLLLDHPIGQVVSSLVPAT